MKKSAVRVITGGKPPTYRYQSCLNSFSHFAGGIIDGRSGKALGRQGSPSPLPLSEALSAGWLAGLNALHCMICGERMLLPRLVGGTPFSPSNPDSYACWRLMLAQRLMLAVSCFAASVVAFGAIICCLQPVNPSRGVSGLFMSSESASGDHNPLLAGSISSSEQLRRQSGLG